MTNRAARLTIFGLAPVVDICNETKRRRENTRIALRRRLKNKAVRRTSCLGWLLWLMYLTRQNERRYFKRARFWSIADKQGSTTHSLFGVTSVGWCIRWDKKEKREQNIYFSSNDGWQACRVTCVTRHTLYFYFLGSPPVVDTCDETIRIQNKKK